MRYPKGFKIIKKCSNCNKLKRIIAHNLCNACYLRGRSKSKKPVFNRVCKNEKCNQVFQTVNKVKIYCSRECCHAQSYRNYCKNYPNKGKERLRNWRKRNQK